MSTLDKALALQKAAKPVVKAKPVAKAAPAVPVAPVAPPTPERQEPPVSQEDPKAWMHGKPPAPEVPVQVEPSMPSELEERIDLKNWMRSKAPLANAERPAVEAFGEPAAREAFKEAKRDKKSLPRPVAAGLLGMATDDFEEFTLPNGEVFRWGLDERKRFGDKAPWDWTIDDYNRIVPNMRSNDYKTDRLAHDTMTSVDRLFAGGSRALSQKHLGYDTDAVEKIATRLMEPGSATQASSRKLYEELEAYYSKQLGITEAAGPRRAEIQAEAAKKAKAGVFMLADTGTWPFTVYETDVRPVGPVRIRDYAKALVTPPLEVTSSGKVKSRAASAMLPFMVLSAGTTPIVEFVSAKATGEEPDYLRALYLKSGWGDRLFDDPVWIANVRAAKQAGERLDALDRESRPSEGDPDYAEWKKKQDAAIAEVREGWSAWATVIAGLGIDILTPDATPLVVRGARIPFDATRASYRGTKAAVFASKLGATVPEAARIGRSVFLEEALTKSDVVTETKYQALRKADNLQALDKAVDASPSRDARDVADSLDQQRVVWMGRGLRARAAQTIQARDPEAFRSLWSWAHVDEDPVKAWGAEIPEPVVERLKLEIEDNKARYDAVRKDYEDALGLKKQAEDTLAAGGRVVPGDLKKLETAVTKLHAEAMQLAQIKRELARAERAASIYNDTYKLASDSAIEDFERMMRGRVPEKPMHEIYPDNVPDGGVPIRVGSTDIEPDLVRKLPSVGDELDMLKFLNKLDAQRDIPQVSQWKKQVTDSVVQALSGYPTLAAKASDPKTGWDFIRAFAKSPDSKAKLKVEARIRAFEKEHSDVLDELDALGPTRAAEADEGEDLANVEVLELDELAAAEAARDASKKGLRVAGKEHAAVEGDVAKAASLTGKAPAPRAYVSPAADVPEASIKSADPTELGFLAEPRYAPQVEGAPFIEDEALRTKALDDIPEAKAAETEDTQGLEQVLASTQAPAKREWVEPNRAVAREQQRVQYGEPPFEGRSMQATGRWEDRPHGAGSKPYTKEQDEAKDPEHLMANYNRRSYRALTRYAAFEGAGEFLRDMLPFVPGIEVTYGSGVTTWMKAGADDLWSALDKARAGAKAPAASDLNVWFRSAIRHWSLDESGKKLDPRVVRFGDLVSVPVGHPDRAKFGPSTVLANGAEGKYTFLESNDEPAFLRIVGWKDGSLVAEVRGFAKDSLRDIPLVNRVFVKVDPSSYDLVIRGRRSRYMSDLVEGSGSSEVVMVPVTRNAWKKVAAKEKSLGYARDVKYNSIPPILAPPVRETAETIGAGAKTGIEKGVPRPRYKKSHDKREAVDIQRLAQAVERERTARDALAVATKDQGVVEAALKRREELAAKVPAEQTGVGDAPASMTRAEAFSELASLQRGAPEDAMLEAQEKGASVQYGWALEHVGDLINRITAEAGWSIPSFGRGYVIDKAGKVLDKLPSLRAEIVAAVQSYAKKSGVPFQQAMDELKALGNKYAEAHATLPVYNDVQREAQRAAVALGKFDFDTARNHLKNLHTLAQRGDAVWNEAAGAFKAAPASTLDTFKAGVSDAEKALVAAKETAKGTPVRVRKDFEAQAAALNNNIANLRAQRVKTPSAEEALSPLRTKANETRARAKWALGKEVEVNANPEATDAMKAEAKAARERATQEYKTAKQALEDVKLESESDIEAYRARIDGEIARTKQAVEDLKTAEKVAVQQALADAKKVIDEAQAGVDSAKNELRAASKIEAENAKKVKEAAADKAAADKKRADIDKKLEGLKTEKDLTEALARVVDAERQHAEAEAAVEALRNRIKQNRIARRLAEKEAIKNAEDAKKARQLEAKAQKLAENIRILRQYENARQALRSSLLDVLDDVKDTAARVADDLAEFDEAQDAVKERMRPGRESIGASPVRTEFATRLRAAAEQRGWGGHAPFLERVMDMFADHAESESALLRASGAGNEVTIRDDVYQELTRSLDHILSTKDKDITPETITEALLRAYYDFLPESTRTAMTEEQFVSDVFYSMSRGDLVDTPHGRDAKAWSDFIIGYGDLATARGTPATGGLTKAVLESPEQARVKVLPGAGGPDEVLRAQEADVRHELAANSRVWRNVFRLRDLAMDAGGWIGGLARENMLAPLKPAVRDAVIDADGRIIELNQELVRETHKLQARDAEFNPFRPLETGLGRSYYDLFRQGANGKGIHARVLHAAAVAYIDPRRVKDLTDDHLKALFAVFKKTDTVQDMSDELFVESERIVDNAGWGSKALRSRGNGDLILAQAVGVGGVQNVLLQNLMGLGAVISPEQAASISRWASGSPDSFDGLQVFQNVMGGSIEKAQPFETFGYKGSRLEAWRAPKTNKQIEKINSLLEGINESPRYIPKEVRDIVAAQADTVFKTAAYESGLAMGTEFVITGFEGVLRIFRQGLTSGVGLANATFHMNNTVGDTVQLYSLVPGVELALRMNADSIWQNALGFPGVAQVLTAADMAKALRAAVTGSGGVAQGTSIRKASASLAHIPDLFHKFLGYKSLTTQVSDLMDAKPVWLVLGGKRYYAPELNRIAYSFGVPDTFEAANLQAGLERTVQNPGLSLPSWLSYGILGANRDVSNTISTRRRYAIFSHLIDMGYEPQVAGEIFREACYDYKHSMGGLDRLLTNTMDPFWSYKKNNLRRLMRAFIVEPMWQEPVKRSGINWPVAFRDAIFGSNKLMKMRKLHTASQGAADLVTTFFDPRDDLGLDLDAMTPEDKAAYLKLRNDYAGRGIDAYALRRMIDNARTANDMPEDIRPFMAKYFLVNPVLAYVNDMARANRYIAMVPLARTASVAAWAARDKKQQPHPNTSMRAIYAPADSNLDAFNTAMSMALASVAIARMAMKDEWAGKVASANLEKLADPTRNPILAALITTFHPEASLYNIQQPLPARIGKILHVLGLSHIETIINADTQAPVNHYVLAPESVPMYQVAMSMFPPLAAVGSYDRIIDALTGGKETEPDDEAAWNVVKLTLGIGSSIVSEQAAASRQDFTFNEKAKRELDNMTRASTTEVVPPRDNEFETYKDNIENKRFGWETTPGGYNKMRDVVRRAVAIYGKDADGNVLAMWRTVLRRENKLPEDLYYVPLQQFVEDPRVKALTLE